MVEEGKPYEVQRTWKERIFSVPLFKKYKIIIPKVPMKNAIKMFDGTLVMHPEMAKIVREQIK